MVAEIIEFQFRRYERKFRKPLRTARGKHEVRIGFVARLAGPDGTEAFGEIAPWPEMGSESVAEAEAFLTSVAKSGGIPGFFAIPSTLPACRWGLSSALESLRRKRPLPSKTFPVAALLPAGAEALQRGVELRETGFQVFKWKIGLADARTEQNLFRVLCRAVPDAVFRLDANGGLDNESAREWLSFLEGMPVAFLEQPLAPAHMKELRALAAESSVPVALDESVGTWRDWENLRPAGWSGPVVVKPSVFGSVDEVRRLAREARVVVSSVFETSVGVEAILQLAGEVNVSETLGLGTGEWMEEDGLYLHGSGPLLRGGWVSPGEIWARLA